MIKQKLSVMEKHEQTKIRGVISTDVGTYESQCYLYDFIMHELGGND